MEGGGGSTTIFGHVPVACKTGVLEVIIFEQGNRARHVVPTVDFLGYTETTVKLLETMNRNAE